MRLTTVLIAGAGLGGGLAHERQRYGAMPSMTDSPVFVPRYFVDTSFPLAKRQDQCDGENHSCEDVKFGDSCCPNNSYCYVDNDGNPRCCPIGSNCVDNSPCDSKSYRCLSTRPATGSTSAAVETGCCPRKCQQTSSYLCPEDRGGGCCEYDAECRQGGNCVRTVEGSRTQSLTPIVEGCTTRQYKCEDGAGCCDDDRICTQISGEGYCAPGEPTQSGIEYIQDDDQELSDGAKAGISVGVVVGAAAVIGGVTWLCLRRRKKRRGTLTQPSGGGGGGGSESQGGPQRDDAVMTEVSASTRPGQVGRGLTQDYFGPDPVAGPFTEREEHTASSSPGLVRAVPTRPQDPSDIAAPVEIDSKSGMTDEDRTSPVSTPSPFSSPRMTDTIDGRFELYGSDMPLPNRPPSIVATPPISPRMDGSRPLSQS